MKKGLVILVVAIATLSGCKSTKVSYSKKYDVDSTSTYVQKIYYSKTYAIDSTSTYYEDPSNPGVMVGIKDTIWIQVINKDIVNINSGEMTFYIEYKIIK